jgi:hypothetical protein
VDRLVGVGFMRCFVMEGLKMQLYLWCAFANWLDIFYMSRIIFGGNVISWDRYRDLLSVSCMKRETVCIVRKGEKQIQILGGY